MNTLKLQRQLRDVLGCLSNKQTTKSSRFTKNKGEDSDLIFEELGFDPFELDCMKIDASKAMRRLENKTQVLTDPHNRHIRNRASHSHEVAGLAAQIASILGLNIPLARAIGLGHDIGHTPFGHLGEVFIQEKLGKKEFTHNTLGVIVARHIERCGVGLNLTKETLSGIGYKTSKHIREEAKVASWADKISYLTGDYNDLRRIGLDIPKRLEKLMNGIGRYQRERMLYFVTGLCLESAEHGKVSFEKGIFAQIFHDVKDLMYTLYPKVNVQNPEAILDPILKYLTHVFGDELNPVMMLALMTDHDVRLLSGGNLDYLNLKKTTVFELISVLKEKRKVCLWKTGL